MSFAAQNTFRQTWHSLPLMALTEIVLQLKNGLQKISKISRQIFQIAVFEIIFRIDDITVVCNT